ncbi:UNVERIFIED_CONTAM: hypothetical protein Slati_1529900 [Sesamum latifolium]|uniref:Uncharacterized protein n=1 Tax=Sesamum latifolium TaxID=2727402 RepID=A0AAW2X8B5_9LAMI
MTQTHITLLAQGPPTSMKTQPQLDPNLRTSTGCLRGINISPCHISTPCGRYGFSHLSMVTCHHQPKVKFINLKISGFWLGKNIPNSITILSNALILFRGKLPIYIAAFNTTFRDPPVPTSSLVSLPVSDLGVGKTPYSKMHSSSSRQSRDRLIPSPPLALQRQTRPCCFHQNKRNQQGSRRYMASPSSRNDGAPLKDGYGSPQLRRGFSFSEGVMAYEFPAHFQIPSHLFPYDGASDPLEHLMVQRELNYYI